MYSAKTLRFISSFCQQIERYRALSQLKKRVWSQIKSACELDYTNTRVSFPKIYPSGTVDSLCKLLQKKGYNISLKESNEYFVLRIDWKAENI